MPYLKLDGFSGLSPRTGPTNLQPNQAQIANNVKLQSGEIRPWRNPTAVYTPGLSDVHTIYRLENTAIGSTAWLEWAEDVDVVPGPVADVTDFRVYYTDGVAPRKTNWNLATTSGTGAKPFPDASYKMGVPAPTTAPSLVKTGGTGTVHEDRAYVYTYVSTFGSVLEESAPSPAGKISVIEPDATVTVDSFATAPTTAAGYNITAIRIYRSVTSATSAQYLYVGQVTVNPATGAASGSFADTVLAANLGVALPSLYYTPPPAGLKGLIAMPNGILAGFTDNQVWFCEPYLPHAWPVAYMMTVGAPIVGLGVFGQTLVVCTVQTPYLITGSQPGAMTQEKVPLPEPCVSKKSITSDQFGVLYASPNGLVSIAPGTQDVISRALFTRDEWQSYIPTSMVGTIYQNMYLAFYQVGSTKAALIIMRGDTPPLVNLSIAAQAVYVERSTANVYVVNPSDNLIYQLDADTVNNMFYEWKSKKFILPEPLNFAVMKAQVDWDAIASVAAYNAIVAEIVAANQAYWATGTTRFSTLNRTPINTYTLNGSILQRIPTVQDARNVQIILYANGVQVYATGVTSQEPQRLPPTGKEYLWEVKITGNVGLRELCMATSITELRQI
jgi:hypothetical protein